MNTNTKICCVPFGEEVMATTKEGKVTCCKLCSGIMFCAIYLSYFKERMYDKNALILPARPTLPTTHLTI